MSRSSLAKIVAAALLAGCLTAAPSFAGNGNGGGNSGGNSSDHSNGHGHSGGKSESGSNGTYLLQKKTKTTSSASTKSTKKAKSVDVAKADTTTPGAKDFGKLNGFLHASPQALANAAPNSSIGLVSVGYADALKSYLDGGDGSASLEDVNAALAAASNKPLSADVVQAINDKLEETDPDLATMIDGYNGGPDMLADDIASNATETTE